MEPAQAFVRWDCPNCGKRLRAVEREAGKRTRCNRCAHLQRIPLAATNDPVAEGPSPGDCLAGDAGTPCFQTPVFLQGGSSCPVTARKPWLWVISIGGALLVGLCIWLLHENWKRLTRVEECYATDMRLITRKGDKFRELDGLVMIVIRTTTPVDKLDANDLKILCPDGTVIPCEVNGISIWGRRWSAFLVPRTYVDSGGLQLQIKMTPPTALPSKLPRRSVNEENSD
jgi:hypothetical protein